MIVPNPDYRPNPNRAIYLQGQIDQQLVDRLAPQIISLQSESRDPITTYIDSPGGSVHLMDTLLRLLTASNQDFADPCRLITVATSKAGSAAADMLASGDYAIAYPESTVLYHGVRFPEDRPLTFELTSLWAQRLRTSNDSYAMRLARQIEDRFMFRFMASKRQFDGIRQKNPKQTMTDLDCFLALISEKLSEQASEVLQTAQQRYGRYDALVESVMRKRLKSSYKSLAEFEALQIRAIVDFEVRSNKKNADWSFEGGGLHRLMDDFFLLKEHLRNFQSDRFKNLCSHWGNFLLDTAETKEINEAPEAERAKKITEKVSPLLQPVWSFFVALCHALQQGENYLTARDAFWLGLIDEVIGVPGLPSRRILSEYQPDPTKGEDEEKPEAGTEEETSAAGA